MEMKINKIYLSNFKCFNAETLFEQEFNNSLTILSGPNGFGKTTIFDGIELIFTGDLTRLNVSHENGNSQFKQHLLLNDSNKNGIVMLEVENTQEKRETLGVIINSDGQNKMTKIRESLQHFRTDILIHEYLRQGDKTLVDFIAEVSQPKYVFDEMLDHFNICYYVSQENSTHLLKESIKKREDTLTPLIGLTEFQEIIVPLNNNPLDEKQKQNDHMIQQTEAKLEEVIAYRKVEYGGIVYNSLLDGYVSDQTDWDSEILPEKYFQKNEYLKLEKKLEFLRLSVVLRDDLDKRQKRAKLLELKNDMDLLSAYNIFQGNLDDQDLESYLKENLDNFKIWSEIFNLKDNLSKDYLDTKEKVSDLIQVVFNLMNLLMQGIKQSEIRTKIKTECEILNQKLSELKELYVQLTTEQKVQAGLIANRIKMTEHLESYVRVMLSEDDVHCPLCNKPFEDLMALKEAIGELTEMLDGVLHDQIKAINERKAELVVLIKAFTANLSPLLEDNSSIRVNGPLYQRVLNSPQELSKMKNLIAVMLEEQITLPSGCNSALVAELLQTVINKETLSDNYLEYFDENQLNMNLYHSFNVSNFSAYLRLVNSLEEPKIVEKKAWLKNKYEMHHNQEYQMLLSNLNKLYEKREQYTKMEMARQQVRRLINDRVKSFKSNIAESIKVPLLVYTAKLLQNYQGGLGVFCDNGEQMRFVSAKGQQDIINRFSSGQLSAFVLTFLIVMNKVYVAKHNKPKFILIDDPVQTMDDINLSSFVDVLRQEFSESQIFLASHVEDMKNYILYKFLKYNTKGMEFNIKDNWYK